MFSFLAAHGCAWKAIIFRRSFFYRTPYSDVIISSIWNSIELCHVFESAPDLKMVVQQLRVLLLETLGLKPILPIFVWFSEISLRVLTYSLKLRIFFVNTSRVTERNSIKLCHGFKNAVTWMWKIAVSLFLKTWDFLKDSATLRDRGFLTLWLILSERLIGTSGKFSHRSIFEQKILTRCIRSQSVLVQFLILNFYVIALHQNVYEL